MLICGIIPKSVTFKNISVILVELFFPFIEIRKFTVYYTLNYSLKSTRVFYQACKPSSEKLCNIQISINETA